MDRILVIDDLPLISLAFQEVFRSVNPSAGVGYCDNLYTALSSPAYADNAFDLVILGAFAGGWSALLEQGIRDLQDRFRQPADHPGERGDHPAKRSGHSGRPAIMLYSAVYDPAIISKMQTAGIDAYVHRHEAVEEIREAYRRISAGTPFLSGIFRTLYYDYGYDVRK